LVPKWANKIGKTVEKISIEYDADGVSISVQSLLNGNGAVVTTAEEVSMADFQARLALHIAPSSEERIRALKRKYELRLNIEFPQEGGPASGSEAHIQSWLDGLPFAQRRALLMSQKDFEKSYPQGFRA
jgi:hypothetical protein